jgi:hypothetical protein
MRPSHREVWKELNNVVDKINGYGFITGALKKELYDVEYKVFESFEEHDEAIKAMYKQEV